MLAAKETKQTCFGFSYLMNSHITYRLFSIRIASCSYEGFHYDVFANTAARNSLRAVFEEMRGLK